MLLSTPLVVVKFPRIQSGLILHVLFWKSNLFWVRTVCYSWPLVGAVHLLETLAIHQTSQVKNIPYQPLLIKPILSLLAIAEKKQSSSIYSIDVNHYFLNVQQKVNVLQLSCCTCPPSPSPVNYWIINLSSTSVTNGSCQSNYIITFRWYRQQDPSVQRLLNLIQRINPSPAGTIYVLLILIEKRANVSAG